MEREHADESRRRHHRSDHVGDTRPLQALTNDQLLHRLAELLRDSRRAEADLVAHIGEVDARRLYAHEACSSMFAYCTERLRLSEAEAYLRITAARAAREHPVVLSMLAEGRLHLSAIARLAPYLTPENRATVLARATHKSKRQIQELVAELSPRPDAPALIRKLPACAAVPLLAHRCGDELVPDRVDARLPARGRTAAVEPIAPSRYKVQFTASEELRDKLERLQALMRSSMPDGDLAAVIEQAVTEKLQRLEARRFATTHKPRKTLRQSETTPSSRRIPAAVRRAVRARAG
jgi:hypothetical protein